MSYYPLTCRDLSLPPLDWPESADLSDPGTPQLFWVAAASPHVHPALQSLSLQPKGEVQEGFPNEGNLPQEAGADAWVPVWLVEHGHGAWWAVDGTTGQICGGVLKARSGPALGRLLLACAAALMLAFIGSTIVFWLLAMASAVMPLLAGPGAARGLSLMLGLVAIVALTWRLNSVLPFLLADPVERAQSGQIHLPVRDDWLGLLQASSTVMGLVSFLGGLGCLANSLSGGGTLPTLFLLLTQAVLAGYLAVKCRQLSRGRPFLSRKVAHWPGGWLGDMVSVGLRIVLFAIAGQLAGAMLATSGFAPRWDVAGLTLQGAQLGAVVAVVTASISGTERAALTAGLVAKSVGEFLMGGWLALLLALLAVAAPGILAAARAPGESRGPIFWNAVQQSWAFSLGLVIGRLLGRLIGLFFLGLGGMAVGEALAEQLAGTAALMGQQRNRSIPA